MDYQVKNGREWIEKSIEAITGESLMVRNIKRLVPAFFTLAVANQAMNLVWEGIK